MAASPLVGRFTTHFGHPPETLVRAPGRVNLIGDHTDYNDGFALPVAIQAESWLALRPRPDGLVRAMAEDFAEKIEWEIAAAPPPSKQGWARYVSGVATLLRELGAELNGFDLLIHSTIPIGSGVSSSAALCIGCAKGLAALCGEALTTMELIDLARMAEERFAGVPCGILDQTAILLAQPGHALLLDCRSREVRPVPLPRGATFFLIDTRLPRTLAGSAYAARRAECEQAVAYFAKLRPGVRALRDLEPETVRTHASQMDPVAFARALHVTTENRRVLEFVQALARREWKRAGQFMNASHASLRDQYEVSTPALERVVQIVSAVPGVFGRRMTGAGFGGSVVCLAETDSRSAIAAALGRDGRAADAANGPTVDEIVPSAGATLERVR